MANFSRGFGLGLLTGAVLGSITAVLVAPDKGSNTRSRLSYQIQTYIDELRSLIDELRDENFSVNSAKAQSDEVVEDAKKKAEDLLREAEDLLSNINRDSA
ncbi:YtxH domain-containing protein [Cyclonatronum proteinivorum]|nr:YtxH domain-containing protein [Cyclonatronum proteinivorum]